MEDTVSYIQRLEGEEKKVRAMADIGIAMSSVVDLDILLEIIMRKVTDIMKAERSTLFLIDSESGELFSKLAQGITIKEIRLKLGEGIAGYVAQTCEPVIVNDAYKDERFNDKIDKITGFKTQSVICIPLINKSKELTGVLQVLNKKDGSFDESDLSLLRALGSQIVVAIENNKLYQRLLEKNVELVRLSDELQKKYFELDLLYDIEKNISQAQSLDELLNAIIVKAMSVIGAEAGSVLLLDEDGVNLYFKDAIGEKGEELKRIRFKATEGIAGWVVSNKTPVISNNPQNDDRHLRSIAESINYFPRNIICVPLMYGDKVIGAFELLNKSNMFDFNENDLKMLTLFSGQVSRAVDMFQNREERERNSRLALIGQMLSSLLHDFKTPMTIISGYSQLIAMEEDRAKRMAFSDLLMKQFEILNNMIREVLSFAKGDSQILIRKVFVGNFLNEVKELLVPEISGKNIELVIDIKYDGPARFDDIKIKRVLINLARNAIEAMPGGGRLIITSEKLENKLIFKVSDSGSGIPEKIKDKLLKKAFVTFGKETGTGLGLAIVKKIVDEHRGEINFESSSDKGTTFIISMPVLENI
ncbi:MAG: GAF domain-containing sensor histidine kinase [Deltaproteobacteria bacterium]|nr:GAF domain-containing sensor histidine kinase [Deltaproteobacteria bacterium]